LIKKHEMFEFKFNLNIKTDVGIIR